MAFEADLQKAFAFSDLNICECLDGGGGGGNNITFILSSHLEHFAIGVGKLVLGWGASNLKRASGRAGAFCKTDAHSCTTAIGLGGIRLIARNAALGYLSI